MSMSALQVCVFLSKTLLLYQNELCFANSSKESQAHLTQHCLDLKHMEALQIQHKLLGGPVKYSSNLNKREKG